MGGRKLIFSLFLFIVLLPISFAFTAESDQFNLTKGVVDTGGQVYDNPQFSGAVSAGLITGEATSDQFSVGLGMFFSENITPEVTPTPSPVDGGGGGRPGPRTFTLTGLDGTFTVREGDLIIVEPWEYSGDTKGDVLYKYTKAQLSFLKRKGYLKQMEDFEEF